MTDSTFTGLAPRKYFSSYGNGSVGFSQIWDPDEVVYDYTNGSRALGTGCWRALTPDDFANFTITGGLFTVGNVAVTGGQINTNVTNTVTVNGGVTAAVSGGAVSVTGSVNTVAYFPSSTAVSNSAPSGANGLALPQNVNRKTWFIQNNSTGAGPLYLRFGGEASTQLFSMLLKPTSTPVAGDGGIFLDDGARWLGSVYVSGNNPSYIIWELT